MNAKQLLVLIIFCGLVGTAGWLVKRNSQQAWDAPETRVGELILPDFPVNEVSRLIITSAEGTLELSKREDYWVVDTSHSYYADFVKIANLLKDIKDLKVMQTIDVPKDDLGRLLLNSPGAETDAGISIEFIGNRDKSIAKLVLGKDHIRKTRAEGSALGGAGSWPDGRYVLEQKSGTVALVSETFSNVKDISTDGWIDKTFLRVDSKIKRAAAREGEKQLWAVSRDKESDSLELDGGVGDDEEIVRTKLNAIDGVLRYSNFSKIADPSIADSDLGFVNNRIFEAETFDGFTYKIDIGKKNSDDDYPFKIAITYNQPEPSEPPADDSDEDKVKREAEFKEKIIAAKDKFENESKRYANWVYMVSSYTVENMLLDRSDLIEKKEIPEKNEEDTANSEASAEVTAPIVGPSLPSPSAEATVVDGEVSAPVSDEKETGSND